MMHTSSSKLERPNQKHIMVINNNKTSSLGGAISGRISVTVAPDGTSSKISSQEKFPKPPAYNAAVPTNQLRKRGTLGLNEIE